VTKVAITGTGLYTPTQQISNQELVDAHTASVDRFNREHAEQIAAGEIAAREHSSDEFIFKASGIRSRHVLDKSGVLDPERMYPRLPQRSNDELSLQAEICLIAAEQALKQADWRPESVDAVLVACSNLQRAYPAVAIEVQAALGAQGYAYDLNVACSSATFGIQAAVDALRAGSARSVLVINPEITSGHNNFELRDHHFIFGDACTAVLLQSLPTGYEARPESGPTHRSSGAPSPSAPSPLSPGASSATAAATAADPTADSNAARFEVLSTRLGTSFSNNIRNNFGFLNRSEEPAREPHDVVFSQNGRQVFRDVCPMVAEHIQTHLSQAGIEAQSLRRLWLHQANANMNRWIGKAVLGHTPSADEAPVILDEYANTSSAGSIIAFHKHHADLERGDTGLICSFGAGYSVGSILIRKL